MMAETKAVHSERVVRKARGLDGQTGVKMFQQSAIPGCCVAYGRKKSVSPFRSPASEGTIAVLFRLALLEATK
jgi:hypothetical protein